MNYFKKAIEPAISPISAAWRNATDPRTIEAAKKVAAWMSPQPLSPVPELKRSSLFERGGMQQAVNNVVAYGTLRPELVRHFENKLKPPPVLGASVQAPTPTPMPNIPTRDELVRTIQNISGNAPMATMAGQMVDQATPSAMYKTNPFLATMIAPTHGNLETRGFRDYQSQPNLVYKPKQAFGWAATSPDYNPPDVKTALQDLLSAVVSGRNMQDEMQRNPNEAQKRMNTSNGYQFFRDNPEQSLDQYFLKYAGPKTFQNKYAGKTYAANARFILNKLAEELDKLMKERGGTYSTRY